MSTFFEGNGFIDGGQIQNVLINNCDITTSSLDMNMENITNVKDPINDQDAATKKYIDNLDITIGEIELESTNNTNISSKLMGSYVVKIENLIPNGPSGIFNITKSNTNFYGQCNRLTASPGYMTNNTLIVSWPPNSGILLRKTQSSYDGEYKVKII